MRTRTIAGLLIACGTCGKVALADVAATPPAGRLPPTVVPTHYALELTIDPRQDRFSGRTAIDVDVREPVRTIWLHALGLDVSEATARVADRTVHARLQVAEAITGVARLEFDDTVPAGRAVLRFRYTAPFSRGAEGLFLAQVGEDRYVFSQMQAIDARRVFPGFDEPGFKTRFDVSVHAPVGDRVIANAPEVESTPAAEGLLRHRFATTEPLPTYLLAFAVGPLDLVTADPIPANAVRKIPLPLRAAATRGNGSRLAYALANTPQMVYRLERYFDIAFPYAKLDLISSPQMAGAMENAGAILYDDNLLLLGADPTPTQRRSYGETHAHELAHQWFGDLVTPQWWDDIWLNESFAEWLGIKVAADWAPGLGSEAGLTAAALETMTTDSLAAGRPIRQAVTDNAQIASTFDAITYRKGAGVLAMFESYLGEDVFRRGVRLHLGRHLHGNATALDFFGAMAEASSQPQVVTAFRSFVEQPGVPLIEVVRSEDGKEVLLTQSRYRPIGSSIEGREQWQVPFCLKLYRQESSAKQCTLLTGKAASMKLRATDGVLMPNADGAGYYRFALDAASITALLGLAATLPDREALALADSVAAAFRAGRLAFTQLLAAAHALAPHPNRQAATRLGYELTDVANAWLDPQTRNALAAELAAIYTPHLASLGFAPDAGRYAAEAPERRLLRRSLVAILGLRARDPELRSTLAKAAQNSLNDPAALDPEFRDIALSVGVQDLAPDFAQRLRERLLASQDAAFRSDAATALGAAERPQTATAALALALDPGIRPGEIFRIVAQQLDQAATREAAWAWFEANFDALSNRLPGFAQAAIVRLPASFCDPAHRREIEAVLGPAVARTGLGTLDLDRTLEKIDLCIAQQQQLEAQVHATFAQR